MVEAIRYAPAHRSEWDRFIDSSKNGTFLFKRDFMEYHAHRFPDHSLLFLDDKQALRAVLPATREGAVLHSHKGLTYGGVISDARMKGELMAEVFEALRRYAAPAGIARVVYRRIPYIYHRLPAEEDLYELYRIGATLIGRGFSSAIAGRHRLAFNSGRRWRIKRHPASAVIGESRDYEGFMQLVTRRLEDRYQLKPVHSAEEIALLARRFPNNIRLFTVEDGGQMHAGAIVFETDTVAHVQYMSSSEEGRALSSLDALTDVLVNTRYAEKPYFDFGIFTEGDGRILNQGLLRQKEELGGRAIMYDTYAFDLA